MPRPTGTCSYNYCKYLIILCWISNWTEEGLSYSSYQENNPWLWNFKNYRPVSNLSFISKLVERVVCVQLVKHLKTNNLYEIFQSAYRQLHSTETALLRVQNDLLQAVDNEGRAILVLLDISAAFDTIDHKELLNLLNELFGIRGVALKWFESYKLSKSDRVHQITFRHVIPLVCSQQIIYKQ